jgi:hypothetical protein
MIRFALTAAATAIAALAITVPAGAQQPTVPAGSVAIVAAEPVTKKSFSRWLRIGLRSYGRKRVFDPPRFNRCAATDRRLIPKGRRRPSLGSLRQRCKRRYDATRRDVLQFLIQGVWIRREAAARGITVTRAQVQRAFEAQRREAFPKKGGYRKFLRDSGMTTGDVLYRVKLDLLQTKIVDRVVAGVPAGEQEAALTAFTEDFRTRSRAATTCAAGYVVAECGNH